MMQSNALMLFTALALGCDQPPPDEQIIEEQRPANIVLVSIDGLRSDRIGLGSAAQKTTPNLDVLAQTGASFVFSFSQANASLLSHASMLTGLYASEIHRPSYLEYIVPDQTLTLSEVLDALGYDTGGFVGGGTMSGTLGFQQGFDVYLQSKDHFGGLKETSTMAIDWLDALEANENPFFVFLHGYDCQQPFLPSGSFEHTSSTVVPPLDGLLHTPQFTARVYDGVMYPGFEPESAAHTVGLTVSLPSNVVQLGTYASDKTNQADATRMGESDLQHVMEHYDSSVLAADTHIGEFLDALTQRGLLDNTLIVITSGHGAELLEHGAYDHRSNLYDTSTRVPLILAGGALPEALRGRAVDNIAQTIDITPTILDMAGTVAPAGSRGRSLLALDQDDQGEEVQVVFQEGVLGQIAARTRNWRLVFAGADLTSPSFNEALRNMPIDGGQFQLFDLQNDPNETLDVLHSHKQVATALRERMLAWREALMTGTTRMDIDPKLREELRQRGYW